MNPFPDTVLTPSSAHRLPTSLYQELIDQLVEHGINAAGFLMDDDLLVDLAKAERRPFRNDPDRAFADLKAQLPDAVREEFWPTPKPIPLMEPATKIPDSTGGDDDDDDDSGMGSGLSIGMSSPGVESPSARRKREEREGRGQRM
jgi:hypothetical protein